MDLGHRVRDLRNARHLSQVELAARAGVARNTLNRIENGHLMPTAPVIEHLAVALGVAPGTLFEEPALAGKAEAPQGTGPSDKGADEEQWPKTVAEVRAKYLPIAAMLNDYCRVYERLLEREELTDDDAVKFARTAVDAKDFHTAVIESELVELGVALDERGGLEEGSPLRDLSVLRDAFSRYYRLMRAIREADLLPDGEEKTALAELAARNA